MEIIKIIESMKLEKQQYMCVCVCLAAPCIAFSTKGRKI